MLRRMGNCITRSKSTESSRSLVTQEQSSYNAFASVVHDDMGWPEPSDVPTVPHQGERVRVLVYDVYDGDTCSIITRMSGNEYLKLKIRVLGVDTPEVEVRGKKKGTELGYIEEQAGAHVREKVKALIEGKECDVRLDKWDKYGGRANGVVYLDSREHATLTEYLLANGYAKPYYGKAKEEWTQEELAEMLAH